MVRHHRCLSFLTRVPSAPAKEHLREALTCIANVRQAHVYLTDGISVRNECVRHGCTDMAHLEFGTMF